MTSRRRHHGFAGGVFGAVLLWALTGSAAAAAPASTSVYLEELTWTELRDRVAGGATTLLVPIGGTEQNGPHMVLGKHNVRARWLAGRIAGKLGNAIVAPVVAYVPEGAIDPPTQHMRYAGTISIPEPAFESTLEASARSLRRHGFCNVVFLSDHGGYLASVERVAARLNRDGARRTPCAALALAEYYRVTQTDYVQALHSKGVAAAEIGSHAGLADTSLALAVEPALVRADVMAARLPTADKDGASGDPRRSSAELGRLGVDWIVDASVAAILAKTRRAP
ncbi:MAG TPA: creatininase family protein [Rubrivivax sp.]